MNSDDYIYLTAENWMSFFLKKSSIEKYMLKYLEKYNVDIKFL